MIKDFFHEFSFSRIIYFLDGMTGFIGGFGGDGMIDNHVLGTCAENSDRAAWQKNVKSILLEVVLGLR